MNAIRNYQKELDKIIEGIADSTVTGLEETYPPRLLLHSCCAPCSSYVLEYLRQYFRITVFYYNPNISSEPEYQKRVAEQKRLIAAYNRAAMKAAEGGLQQDEAASDGQPQDKGLQPGPARSGYYIEIIEGDYEPERFFEIAKGLEQCPEGGERCFVCYELRLRKTAKEALAGAYDYFTTTLTISPLKNAAKLNEIGERLSIEYGIKWLPSDFKKRGGYQRSIVLSKEYDLYRQNYCGCVYSRKEKDILVSK
ncbi:MAG: epoxyqueuosine reductase QueH [Bacillus sp. (in: Bacteria)]|nr:epoxyqueuosine reductase QueH [Bacillus sp. (in: firmicutes)]MCM1427768.1 epoxyqueuosine reductase QueH [Eubacterium sp.]